MLILDKRPDNNKFDDRLRGYNGRYCYYDELSKWEKAGLDNNSFLFKILFFLFY
jgi:hypothetical protein